MSEAFPDLQALLQCLLNTSAALVTQQSCSGGCIHRAEIVTLSDGIRCFVKSSRNARAMFELEAKGLEALSNGTLAVPQVIGVGSYGDTDCLVLEAIETGSPDKAFFERLGAGLAGMHQQCQHSQFGWESSNYLGSSIQPNHWNADWIDFFRAERLVYQFEMARRSGLGSRELFKLGDKLCGKLPKLIGMPEDPPSLLHGDLWSGNFLSAQSGEPVLIDPAVYFGRREADLAMPALFGGFPATFWSAYSEAWPLEDDWQDRVEVYKLYHLLNHLNLFGSGYLDDCLEILRRYA